MIGKPAKLFQGAAMFRRPAFSVLAIIVAFGSGALVSNQMATVSAQPAANAPQRKCVGIAAIGPTNGTSARLYRAFEDGSIEIASEMGGKLAQDWKPVEKK
jgi:hypothetical protein